MELGDRSNITPLPESDVRAFIALAANAYPALGFSDPQTQDRLAIRYTNMQRGESAVRLYGCYRDDTLVGGMMLYDFQMRFLSTDILVGGVGMVAVDLPYKKAKVARDMIQFYLDHYRRRGALIAMLYPFRPDFYKAMGFGIGAKMHQYAFAPNSIPKGASKSAVRLLSTSDAEAITACHNALAKHTHGMTIRRVDEIKATFANPEHRVAGVWHRDGKLGGYMCFSFSRAHDTNFGLNDLHVWEYVFHSTSDFRQLMEFLRTQSDQVRHIVMTTPDEDLHHFLIDPRDPSNNLLPHVYHQSSAAGVGLMYRVLDVPGIFQNLCDHEFPSASFSVKLNVSDTLCKEHAGSTSLNFEDGCVKVMDSNSRADVEVDISIADLSSLLMGTISFQSLVRYGLVGVSDCAFVPLLNRAFTTPEKPVCWARF